MKLLFPEAHCLNTVSLRTPVLAPGYQIARFFLEYASSRDSLTADDLKQSLSETARNHPQSLYLSDIPLGSRAFSMMEVAAVALSSSEYLHLHGNPLQCSPSIAEIIVQGYVHNVRGYCRSVLETVSKLCQDQDLLAFFPNVGT